MLDDELLQIFFEDATENMEDMEKGLLALEKTPEDRQLVDMIFRAVHTLKSGAGMVGLNLLSDLAHHLENLLEDFRSQDRSLPPYAFDLLFSGADLIKAMLAAGDANNEVFKKQVASVINQVNQFEGGTRNSPAQPAGPKKGNRFYKIILKFNPHLTDRSTNPLKLFPELEKNGVILEKYINLSQLPDIFALDPHQLHIFWTIFYETKMAQAELEQLLLFVADKDELGIEEITAEIDSWFNEDKLTGELLVERGLISPEDIAAVLKKQKRIGELLVENGKISNAQIDRVIETQQQQRMQKEVETIRVKTQKLEKILNNIGDLVVAQSRVKELVAQHLDTSSIRGVEIFNSFQEVDKIIRLLQEDTMEASMVPIGTTFLSYQRLVRDLAGARGKKVELIISGKETELDKKIIEQLNDPLKHLIRNAIDHGLETPAARRQKDKSETGAIHMRAFHQEGKIVIEISDDGRGIDEDAVLAKARERGLVEPQVSLSNREIQNLLFRPGFSTARQVSEISGRGVGLDVVMANIKKLGGEINIFSQKDQGTTFRIKLPLTQAILDGMVIRLGKERLIIPLTAIYELVKAEKKDFHRAEGKGLIVRLRDEYIPFFPLYQLTNLVAEHHEPTAGIIVVLWEQGKKIALLVDEIIGQEQVVIKSIERNLEQIPGVAGATILGNGKVALIIDVAGLLKLTRECGH